jgi:hypothetical protein
MTHETTRAQPQFQWGTVCFHNDDRPDDWPHWNDGIPGAWQPLVRPDEAGSYVASFIESDCGVYRLVSLAQPGINEPALLDRICGSDKTGTLYVGCAGSHGTLQSRLGSLLRTLRARKGFAYSGHKAADFLRSHPLLSKRFPLDNLAVTWSYDPHQILAEQIRLSRYVRSFGEVPPLNLKLDII